jgi:hypothetical protein
MTILDMQQLGYSGEEIVSLLSDIVHSVKNNESITGYEFEDNYERIEYIEETVSMIHEQLCNLKQNDNGLY